jgi:hypothetical protein
LAANAINITAKKKKAKVRSNEEIYVGSTGFPQIFAPFERGKQLKLTSGIIYPQAAVTTNDLCIKLIDGNTHGHYFSLAIRFDTIY